MKRNEILKLAEDAKLEFSEEELVKLEAELSAIEKKILPVKMAKVEGNLFEKTVGINSLREDNIIPSLKREKILKTAPNSNDEYVVVPKVMED